MRRLAAHRPSPALAISIVALFVALGGTGYAALKLPRNSVGSAQIRTGAVGSSEVRNGSLRLRDFHKGQLHSGRRGPQGQIGPIGPIGPAGPSGTNGHDGAPGARGPSDGYVSGANPPGNDSNSVSVTVPPGDYVAAASGQAFYYRTDSTYPGADGEVSCSLTSAADASDRASTFATIPSHGYVLGPTYGGLTTVSQNTGFQLPSGGTITYTCGNAASFTPESGATAQYANMRVTAIQVGALH